MSKENPDETETSGASNRSTAASASSKLFLPTATQKSATAEVVSVSILEELSNLMSTKLDEKVEST
jgi:hypothetical protein